MRDEIFWQFSKDTTQNLTLMGATDTNTRSNTALVSARDTLSYFSWCDPVQLDTSISGMYHHENSKHEQQGEAHHDSHGFDVNLKDVEYVRLSVVEVQMYCALDFRLYRGGIIQHNEVRSVYSSTATSVCFIMRLTFLQYSTTVISTTSPTLFNVSKACKVLLLRIMIRC